MSLGLARFPFVGDLDGLDLGAQPSLDKQQIGELATGRFVANGEVVRFLGTPGPDKTHLAIALGRTAIREGCSVLFGTAPALTCPAVPLGRSNTQPGGSILRVVRWSIPHVV